MIIQKFHICPAGKPVGKIYVAANQSIQLFYLGHSLNMEVVYFSDQLLFELLKLPVVAELLVFFPVVQFGQCLFQINAGLLFGKVFIYHMPYTDIDQVIHITVGICPVGIAPLAIIFVERTVLILTDNRIIQRHSAALADQLIRRSKQSVDGNIEKLRQLF